MCFVLTSGDTSERIPLSIPLGYSATLSLAYLYGNKTIQIIYASLHEYKPTADGERLWATPFVTPSKQPAFGKRGHSFCPNYKVV
jgi:hypothetical protein